MICLRHLPRLTCRRSIQGDNNCPFGFWSNSGGFGDKATARRGAHKMASELLPPLPPPTSLSLVRPPPPTTFASPTLQYRQLRAQPTSVPSEDLWIVWEEAVKALQRHQSLSFSRAIMQVQSNSKYTQVTGSSLRGGRCIIAVLWFMRSIKSTRLHAESSAVPASITSAQSPPLSLWLWKEACDKTEQQKEAICTLSKTYLEDPLCCEIQHKRPLWKALGPTVSNTWKYMGGGNRQQHFTFYLPSHSLLFLYHRADQLLISTRAEWWRVWAAAPRHHRGARY